MLATTALCLYSSLINGKRSVEEQRDFFTWCVLIPALNYIFTLTIVLVLPVTLTLAIPL